mmetsp:Transcript_9452/g.19065  ORF Transcript_9452/g.19065 Transcript_9452/m.19065 type:complete len:351 (-) Transcript_9452:357-1409(-)
MTMTKTKAMDRNSSTSMDETEVMSQRLNQLEKLTGLPSEDSSRLEKITTWLINQANEKLHILGPKAGIVIALVILMVEGFFLVWFSLYQRRQCNATTNFMVGELPARAFQELFQKDKVGSIDQEIYICTTSTLLTGQFIGNIDEATPQDGILAPGDGWAYHVVPKFVPCTLRGFSYKDYDIEYKACPSPSSYGIDVSILPDKQMPHGCSPFPSDIHLFDRYADSTPQMCDDGTQERICAGVVSVGYYTCPLLVTVVGASLGYMTLVQVATASLLMIIYVKCRGRKYTYQDLAKAFKEDTHIDTVAKERSASQKLHAFPGNDPDWIKQRVLQKLPPFPESAPDGSKEKVEV